MIGFYSPKSTWSYDEIRMKQIQIHLTERIRDTRPVSSYVSDAMVWQSDTPEDFILILYFNRILNVLSTLNQIKQNIYQIKFSTSRIQDLNLVKDCQEWMESSI